jgi:hypothetical protein
MNVQQRMELLVRLGEYILSNDDSWLDAKEKAYHQNKWFTPEFTDLATYNIAHTFLTKDGLQEWIKKYNIPFENREPKKVGLVMAGNIPLVGFHDFLAIFISGNRMAIKMSSKDDVLFRHLVQQLTDWEPAVKDSVVFQEMLKGCDAYIATGSNNSARYFEYYFKRFPHIIRRNRTSVAILSGNETKEELEKLADDVYQYFGLGCRNVTKIYVPAQYDFVPLLDTFSKYNYLADQHKYKNNYDYALAVVILNKEYYMTNGSVILRENTSIFSGISQLHYEYYNDEKEVYQQLKNNAEVQCIVGKKHIPFGQAQQPCLSDYADGVDTLQFLLEL